MNCYTGKGAASTSEEWKPTPDMWALKTRDWVDFGSVQKVAESEVKSP
jgi:hypothetical protein